MSKSTSHLTLTFAIIHRQLLWNIVLLAFAISLAVVQAERIDLEIGGSANVTCTMNLTKFPGKTSSSMYFVEEDTGRRVPQSDIAIVNETTIVYMIRNATRQDRDYDCKSDRHGVKIVHITVGSKPTDVTDFRCRGYNYHYMVCNFSLPDNPTPTIYSLTFTTHSVLYKQYYLDKTTKQVVSRPIFSQNYLQNCSLVIQNEREVICNITLENSYRPDYELYNFTLTGSNDLGVHHQNFKVNQSESIIPPRPEIKFQQITTNSVLLTWHMNRYVFYGKNLQYELIVQPENMPPLTNYNVYDRPKHKGAEYSIQLRNLPYAYYNYTIKVRLRMRSERAEYSEAFVGVVRTEAKIPDTSPETDAGSFYVDSTETHVRLYWQPLPEFLNNGPNFRYVVTEVKRNGIVVDLQPLKIDHQSAKFTWDGKYSYSFALKSRNDMGDSPSASYIHIPAMPGSSAAYTPNWIRDISANRSYTLSWSAPTEQAQLIDYTVYWCPAKPNIRNDCKDRLQFRRLPRETTRFTTPEQAQDQHLNLAVSANFIGINTGMQWSMCTADVSSDLVKLEPKVHALSEHTLEVRWNTDCKDTALLDGYNLTYCQVESVESKSQCMPGTQRSLIVEHTAKKHLLAGLRPFSLYKIEMFLFYGTKVGRTSDAQVVRTNEGVPSPPRLLNFANVTSNSVCLSWLPPSELNGLLSHYTIVQNNEHHILNCTNDLNNTCHLNASNDQQQQEVELHYCLDTLSSYTDYSIYITAHTHTVEGSEPSNVVHFKTLIGIPSNPQHIEVNIQNNQKILKWSPPEVYAGRLEYYEVAITVWYKDQMIRQRISGIINATSCYINKPECKDNNYVHTVQVRAVNVAKIPSESNPQSARGPSRSSLEQQEDIDSLYHNGNEDLQCIETSGRYSQLALQKELGAYRNQAQYQPFKSVWENGTIVVCAATQTLTASLVLPVSVLFALIAFSFLYYFARKKYNKMADIKCELPPGLAVPYNARPADNYHHDTEQDDDDFKRSKESLFNTEERHLLSSVHNDSGYLCGGGGGNGVDCDNGGDGGLTPSSLGGKSSGYAGSDEHVAASNDYTPLEQFERLQKGQTLTQSQPQHDDDYMPMEVQQKQKPADLSNKVTHDGYIDPSVVFNKPARPSALNIVPPASSSCYIKPNQILSWQPTATTAPNTLPTISGGGYVSPQMLEKMQLMPPTQNGYTSLAALGKPQLGIPTTLSQQQQQATHQHFHGGGGGGVPPISGYVTQKELSAFGQQQHIS